MMMSISSLDIDYRYRRATCRTLLPLTRTRDTDGPRRPISRPGSRASKVGRAGGTIPDYPPSQPGGLYRIRARRQESVGLGRSKRKSDWFAGSLERTGGAYSTYSPSGWSSQMVCQADELGPTDSWRLPAPPERGTGRDWHESRVRGQAQFPEQGSRVECGYQKTDTTPSGPAHGIPHTGHSSICNLIRFPSRMRNSRPSRGGPAHGTDCARGATAAQKHPPHIMRTG